jgi:hypothetical protein
MSRPRSNALQTGQTIEVSGFAVGSFANFDPQAVYYPAPGNPRFMAAYIGNRRAGHPMKGWKIHISAYPYNAVLVAERVLPVLCGLKIWHKYIKSPMDLSRMTELQRGKFITVYTRDTDVSDTGDETRLVVEKVGLALAGSGLSGPDIEEERALAPSIFARYSYDYTKPGE